MGRILLVDESDGGRRAVAEAIRRLTAHVVDEAGDGLEALARVHAADYDLVLLDVQMPGVDGFEVCRRLRADPRTRPLPVLFLTAKAQQAGSRLKGLEVGADDFIVQPVSDQELAARIKGLLRVKALSDEVRRHNAELETNIRDRTRTMEQLADQLREERDTLRETFDVFDEALLLVDGPGQMLVANAAGRRLNQTALAPELGALASDAATNAAICDRALAEGGRSFVGRAYPVSGRRVLLYVRDVTEERDDEMRRLQAEKLASIGTLAAGVAHEINNPAAFVLGNVEALSAHMRRVEDELQVVADPKARGQLQALLFEITAILQETKEGMARIHRIVRDLSSFSHVDDDAGTLTDPNAAVESTLTLLRHELRHRATVARELRATRLVRANGARLGQVFLNLILNAAQALDPTESGNNRIIVRTFDSGEDIVFEVSDNGAGIAPDVLPRIFDSFFTTKARGVGTGLGLSISHGIVRAFGGEITVDTRLGEGATFRVRLPSAPATPATQPALGSSAPIYRRRRILAIDDEPLLLKAYRRMLADVHDVVTALGGKDALLLMAKDRNFDVVLCDLQMPDMSGMDLFLAAKNRYPDLAARFVFVTGGAFSTEAKRFLEQAVTSISKPFRIDELLAVIDAKVSELGPERAPDVREARGLAAVATLVGERERVG